MTIFYWSDQFEIDKFCYEHIAVEFRFQKDQDRNILPPKSNSMAVWSYHSTLGLNPTKGCVWRQNASLGAASGATRRSCRARAREATCGPCLARDLKPHVGLTKPACWKPHPGLAKPKRHKPHMGLVKSMNLKPHAALAKTALWSNTQASDKPAHLRPNACPKPAFHARCISLLSKPLYLNHFVRAARVSASNVRARES